MQLGQNCTELVGRGSWMLRCGSHESPHESFQERKVTAQQAQLWWPLASWLSRWSRALWEGGGARSSHWCLWGEYGSTEETIAWPLVVHSMVSFSFSKTRTCSLLVPKLINYTFYKLQSYLSQLFPATLSSMAWRRQKEATTIGDRSKICSF